MTVFRPRLRSSLRLRPSVSLLGALLVLLPVARAAERVTLKSGFEIDCVRHSVEGPTVRLYTQPVNGSENYVDVPAASVTRIETLPDLPVDAVSGKLLPVKIMQSLQPTVAELHEMLSRSGAAHHIDVDLLASVVHAESGGHVKAVSRTGARGLMQLMPATAAALGVADAFIAEQNVEGGTKYLDELLTKYHDNVALALAAYNAGPGAVDRFHGVPPFRETRAYVSRVIREFNRRKTTLLAQAK